MHWGTLDLPKTDSDKWCLIYKNSHIKFNTHGCRALKKTATDPLAFIIFHVWWFLCQTAGALGVLGLKHNTCRQRYKTLCEWAKRRKIEGNPKCRHLKQLTCKGTLRQAFIRLSRSEAPFLPMTPFPPLHTVFVCAVYLFTRGRGGFERREKGTTVTVQSWVENTSMLSVSPDYKLW